MVTTRNRPILFAFIATLGALGGASGGCGESHEGGLSQVDAAPSLPGLCPASGESCADEGHTRCDEGGLRTCVEVTAGCLQWGVAVPCAPGSTCIVEDVASCAPSCLDEACTVPEARRCAPGDATSFQRCADDDHDGCLGWSEPIACDGGETCGQGGACGASCVDECVDGAARCDGDAVVTCGQHDGDACLEWGAPAACPKACALGRCVDACADECATDGLRRCNGSAVDVCEEGADGCRHWAAAESCGAGTTCSAGACGASCVDECVAGEAMCEAGGVVACGDFDADPCTDLGLPAACDAGESCSGGACTALLACGDECGAAGDVRCDPTGLGVERCGDYDADPCLEWEKVDQCGAGESCSLGRCVAGCEDECEAGAHRCQPGSDDVIEECRADADLDPCREWAAASSCADSHQICDGGACASTCTDECPGHAVCDGDAVVACGEFDGDPCLDLGVPTACAPAERCVERDVGAVCGPAPAPAALVISEVLVNAPGEDHDVFIELAGPAGTPLAGFVLEAVNGGTGETYATLALGGQIGASGRWVVAHPQAGEAIASAADLKDTFADLQNGPDNLLLRWGDTVVDALGYGRFAAGDAFRGEGHPAVDVAAGHSLARVGDLQDTGDNAVDFAEVLVPTPGSAFVATRRPDAFGDVVITEVMADPSAVSDQSGEWIELFNPHEGVTWDLEGCTLESEPAEVYTIDVPLSVPPGGRVVIARSTSPGFVPDDAWTGIGLTNSGDAIGVWCGDTLVDDFVWLSSAPNGKSMSVDPLYESASLNDELGAWCPAPVAAASGKDAATPGDANPPCPISGGGTYAQTALDSQWGSCNELPDWQSFAFDAAPDATGDGALSFQWLSVYCPIYASSSDLWIELRKGDGSWQEVTHATLSNVLQACSWQSASATVPSSLIDSARATTGRIEGRFRIEGGCPQGVGCGILGQSTPYNCARKLTLTYSY